MNKISFLSLVLIPLIMLSGCVTKEGNTLMTVGFFNSSTGKPLTEIQVYADFVCQNQGVTVDAKQITNHAFVLEVPPACGNITVTAEAEGYAKKIYEIPKEAKKTEISLEPL